jgi:hypothetical protein
MRTFEFNHGKYVTVVDLGDESELFDTFKELETGWNQLRERVAELERVAKAVVQDAVRCESDVYGVNYTITDWAVNRAHAALDAAPKD